MSKRHIFSRIREIAGARANMPVDVVDGNKEPTLVGKGWHYRTCGGNYIRYPSAYSTIGWSNMVYWPSTLRVEVGRDWLEANWTEEERIELVKMRLAGVKLYEEANRTR